jgi:superkiller protein 3
LLANSRVHLAFHDLDEAIPPLLKAVELNSNFALAWFGLANVLWRQNFSERALEAIEKAIELSPFYPFMPIFLYNRGIILLILKDYGGAISASTQAIQMGPVPPWAKITQVTALWHIGKYDLAREGALQLLELHPNLNIAEIRNGAGSEKSLWYLQIAPVLRELNIPEEAR